MTEHKVETVLISLILFVSIIAPLVAVDLGSAASDWPSVPGNNENPWISDALSPTIDEDLAIKWSVIGATSGMSGWEVPSTAITVGDYAYYYDQLNKKLMKVHIEDGAEAASAPLTASGYNLPVTYGNGKLFVPMINSKVSIYDADTMEKIGTTDTKLTKWNGMQGPVTYYDEYIYLGTYGSTYPGIDFACFHDNGTLAWSLDGGGWGYSLAPQFIEVGDKTYCVVASKGYGQAGITDGGSTIYVLDPATGYEYSRVKISDEYNQGGISHYEGRIYVATQNDAATATHIHSYVVGADGSLSDEKVWTSSLTGGTQSVPVIYNDRIYLGSGGATMGANRNIEVISIGSDGSMTSVYDIPIKTKGTLTLTTAYATAENDYTVYLYVTPYDGTSTNPDIYIIKDSAHQTAAHYKGIELPGEGDQYSFNSVTISSQGYLLFKSDVALWCVEAVREESTPGTEFQVSASSDADGKLIVTYNPSALRFVSATGATNIVTAEGTITITTAGANGPVDVTFAALANLGPTTVTLNGESKVFNIVPGEPASYSSFVIVEQDGQQNTADVSLYKVPKVAGFKLVFHYTGGTPVVSDLAGLGAKGIFSTAVDEVGKTITIVWASSRNMVPSGILFSISGADGLTLSPADAELRYIADDVSVSIQVIVGVASSYEDAVSQDPNPAPAADLNGDGETNLADLILLVQFLAGNEVNIDEDSADLDGDGIVDIRDAIALQEIITVA